MNDEKSEEEAVELGDEVATRRKPTGAAVVAVRVPRDLLTGISTYAQAHGMTVSDVLREGAQRVVYGASELHFVTGTSVVGTGVHQGSSSQGTMVRSFSQSPDWSELA
ncbi:MAG: hypothetical protein ABSD62_02990 [Candidatus Limnocylindrales bacterium]